MSVPWYTLTRVPSTGAASAFRGIRREDIFNRQHNLIPKHENSQIQAVMLAAFVRLLISEYTTPDFTRKSVFVSFDTRLYLSTCT